MQFDFNSGKQVLAEELLLILEKMMNYKKYENTRHSFSKILQKKKKISGKFTERKKARMSKLVPVLVFSIEEIIEYNKRRKRELAFEILKQNFFEEKMKFEKKILIEDFDDDKHESSEFSDTGDIRFEEMEVKIFIEDSYQSVKTERNFDSLSVYRKLGNSYVKIEDARYENSSNKKIEIFEKENLPKFENCDGRVMQKSFNFEFSSKKVYKKFEEIFSPKIMTFADIVDSKFSSVLKSGFRSINRKSNLSKRKLRKYKRKNFIFLEKFFFKKKIENFKKCLHKLKRKRKINFIDMKKFKNIIMLETLKKIMEKSQKSMFIKAIETNSQNNIKNTNPTSESSKQEIDHKNIKIQAMEDILNTIMNLRLNKRARGCFFLSVWSEYFYYRTRKENSIIFFSNLKEVVNVRTKISYGISQVSSVIDINASRKKMRAFDLMNFFAKLKFERIMRNFMVGMEKWTFFVLKKKGFNDLMRNHESCVRVKSRNACILLMLVMKTISKREKRNLKMGLDLFKNIEEKKFLMGSIEKFTKRNSVSKEKKKKIERIKRNSREKPKIYKKNLNKKRKFSKESFEENEPFKTSEIEIEIKQNIQERVKRRENLKKNKSRKIYTFNTILTISSKENMINGEKIRQDEIKIERSNKPPHESRQITEKAKMSLKKSRSMIEDREKELKKNKSSNNIERKIYFDERKNSRVKRKEKRRKLKERLVGIRSSKERVKIVKDKKKAENVIWNENSSGLSFGEKSTNLEPMKKIQKKVVRVKPRRRNSKKKLIGKFKVKDEKNEKKGCVDVEKYNRKKKVLKNSAKKRRNIVPRKNKLSSRKKKKIIEYSGSKNRHKADSPCGTRQCWSGKYSSSKSQSKKTEKKSSTSTFKSEKKNSPSERASNERVFRIRLTPKLAEEMTKDVKKLQNSENKKIKKTPQKLKFTPIKRPQKSNKMSERYKEKSGSSLELRQSEHDTTSTVEKSIPLNSQTKLKSSKKLKENSFITQIEDDQESSISTVRKTPRKSKQKSKNSESNLKNSNHFAGNRYIKSSFVLDKIMNEENKKKKRRRRIVNKKVNRTKPKQRNLSREKIRPKKKIKRIRGKSNINLIKSPEYDLRRSSKFCIVKKSQKRPRLVSSSLECLKKAIDEINPFKVGYGKNNNSSSFEKRFKRKQKKGKLKKRKKDLIVVWSRSDEKEKKTN